MDLFMKEILKIAIYRDSGFIIGQMENNTGENGKKIWWMGKENYCGQMENVMKGNSRMIKNMVKAFLNGLMAGNI
jgi:hypothetical protein